MSTKPRRFVSRAPVRPTPHQMPQSDVMASISGRLEALADLLADGAPKRLASMPRPRADLSRRPMEVHHDRAPTADRIGECVDCR